MVFDTPAPDFSSDKTNGCAPLTVQFTDKSTKAPGTTNVAWLWDFGNGIQSTQQNPTVKFTSPGAFTVVLKVTNDKGCVNVLTRTKYIDVGPGVVVGFTNSDAQECTAPFKIDFTNTSVISGTPFYLWDFGDGKTSTQKDPSHIYAAAGTYPVKLIVGNGSGCADTLVKSITIANSYTDFKTSDSICFNQPVNFTNNSSPSPLSSVWSFSDGTVYTTKDVSKTFSAPGTYTVKLTNTFNGCSNSKEKTIVVESSPTAAFTQSIYAKCSPNLTVNFINKSVNAVKYVWDFGDGSAPLTTTSLSTSYTYTKNGIFLVSLTAINSSGCANTYVSDKPVVIGPPTAALTGIPERGCLPVTVTPGVFINTLSDIASYQWNFGDGNTSALKSPTHTYTTPGTYILQFTVTTVDGCSTSASDTLSVGNHSVPAFTATPRDVCAKDTIRFTNLTTPAGGSYIWSFGDGGTDTRFEPKYNYNDTGWFQVKLVVDNNGCRDSVFSALKYIYIKAPIARFSLKANCNASFEYQFVDESLFDKASEGKRTWLWKMPDGSTSNLQNPPPYTFPGAGEYSVTLTVSNGECEHKTTKKLKIVSREPDIAFNKDNNCQPAVVTFKAQSAALANVMQFKWELNGFDTVTAVPELSYRFLKSGDYTVKLTTTDGAGCANTVSKPIVITGPKAGFKRINVQECKKMAVTLRDTSKAFGNNPIKNWEWNFGDGIIVNKTDSLPVEHIYTKGGTYKIQLKITDISGCTDTTSLVDSVKIIEVTPDFTITENACLGFPVSYQNTSTGGFVSILWDFGDSTARITNNAGEHLYKDTGFYSIKLITEDITGCKDSLVRKQYVHIAKPFASFSVKDSVSFCPPFDVQFRNTSQFFSRVQWQILDEKSNETDHRKLFTQPGNFPVKLTVTSPDGNCTSEATKTIVLRRASDAKLTYDPLQACVPGLANFSAFDSLTTARFFWDFGDGTIMDTLANKVSHTYKDLGSFTPKIILKESNGCVVTIAGLSPINIKGAKAKFDVDKSFFCDSGLIQIKDSTTYNEPVTYHWDFGDGTTSTLREPRHNFTKSGNFPILLTVTTESGCIDSSRMTTPVKVVSSPVIDILGDSVICINDRIQHSGLIAVDTSRVRWNWRFPNGNTANTQNPIIQQYKIAGTFPVSVTVVNSSGCADTAVKNIVVNPLPQVTLPPVLTIQVGGTVTLPAKYTSGIVSYTWTPDLTLSCNNCPQPVSSPRFDTEYKVSVTDSNGCVNSGSVKVIVLCKGVTVFIPNTFSPNGDGRNDVFYVRGQGLDRIKSLQVFNRWGQLVFEQKDFPVNAAQNGWNGMYKGMKASPDVYVYQLDVYCANGQILHYTGNIALIE